MEPTVTSAHMYVPITRIDKDEWIVEGQATSDAVDHYGTIFDYESSKKAFAAWRGNIREMHDPKKAVGRAIEVTPDDENKRIMVRARISKGARDTWEKVLDGTLSGFSIGAYWEDGKPKIERVQRNGKEVSKYVEHKVAETSLVDNAGSPGCDIAIVRADGILTEVLDNSEATTTPEAQPDETRDGARISHVTQDALHGMRDGHLHGMKKAMEICQCDECKGGLTAMDPDGDGDCDVLGGIGDLDGDAGQSTMMSGYRELEPIIMRALTPTIQRFNAMAAQMAMNTTQPQTTTIDTSAIERRLVEIEKLVPGIAEVRSLLSEVKELAAQSHEIIERVEKQPVPGGPIASGAAMDKILATQMGASSAAGLNDAEVIQRAAKLGLLTDERAQIAGATVQIAQMLGQR